MMQATAISVLLIEDNEDHRVLVRRHLQRCRGTAISLDTAGRLDEGLEHLHRHGTPAVLLDLRLPDSSGLETLERIQEAAPESAVVVLSSLDDEELAVTAVQRGAQDYLVKSQLTGELLWRSIRYALERKGNESHLEALVAQRTGELRETNQRLKLEIEEHKQARRQLAEQHQRLLRSERLAAIGEMVAGLTHESRNALQRSQACLSMLAHRVQDRPKALELVSRLQEAQDHLHHLYERVRQYAAPIQLERQPDRLDDIARRAWQHLEVARQVGDARLQLHRASFALACRVDPFAIEQVFRNILENSLGAEASQIDVFWSQVTLSGAPAVRVIFRDNGPGLTPQQQVRLFEPFFTTKVKGTGLGMAIAQRLVEAHGGQIEAGSYEGGAEISITLPCEGADR